MMSLKHMLNEHYYCRTEEEEAAPVTSAPIPVVETPAEPEPAVVSNDTVEEDIDELLKDL
jgi:hypothetical protein